MATREEIEFKVGDKVTTLDTKEKGTIARITTDKEAIFVRWDKDKSQGMVKTSSLKKD